MRADSAVFASANTMRAIDLVLSWSNFKSGGRGKRRDTNLCMFSWFLSSALGHLVRLFHGPVVSVRRNGKDASLVLYSSPYKVAGGADI